MNQKLLYWRGKTLIITCLKKFFVLVILFSTATIVRTQAQPTPTITPPQKLKYFKLEREELFNKDKVKYLVAITGETVQEISSSADLNKLAINSVLAARINEKVKVESMTDRKTRILLPYKFALPASVDSEVKNLRAVAELEQGGLHWEPQHNQFRGSLLVGLENEDSPGAPPVDLPYPVVFQFTFSSGGVSPDTKDVTHTNLPYSRVNLAADEKPVSSILKILTTFDPDGVEVNIPVVLPIVKLNGPSSIPGMGFGFGEITVTLPSNLAGSVTYVTLSIDHGFLDPNPLSITVEGIGVSRLRSSGMGKAKIELVDTHLESDPVYVDYVFPVFSLIFILIGAIFSGFLFKFSSGKFLVGLLLGLILAIAYSASISLIDIDLGKFVTEVGGLVAAAVPGFFRFSIKRG